MPAKKKTRTAQPVQTLSESMDGCQMSPKDAEIKPFRVIKVSDLSRYYGHQELTFSSDTVTPNSFKATKGDLFKTLFLIRELRTPHPELITVDGRTVFPTTDPAAFDDTQPNKLYDIQLSWGDGSEYLGLLTKKIRSAIEVTFVGDSFAVFCVLMMQEPGSRYTLAELKEEYMRRFSPSLEEISRTVDYKLQPVLNSF